MNAVDFEKKSVIPSKIVCAGKNYYSHIKEMGGRGRPREPIIFIKPNSAVVSRKNIIFIPQQFGILHHEVELCFLVGKKCKGVDVDAAKKFIAGFAVGIDFTLRSRQNVAKRAGEPWTLSKGFDSSCALGRFVGSERIKDLASLKISLRVNGEVKQMASMSEMIFSPADLLSYSSQFMTIEEGDIFMCGTPEGVDEVKHGDEIDASIKSLPKLLFKVLRKKD